MIYITFAYHKNSEAGPRRKSHCDMQHLKYIICREFTQARKGVRDDKRFICLSRQYIKIVDKSRLEAELQAMMFLISHFISHLRKEKP